MPCRAVQNLDPGQVSIQTFQMYIVQSAASQALKISTNAAPHVPQPHGAHADLLRCQPDTVAGQHWHHNPLCWADIACLEVDEQQSSRYSGSKPLCSSQAQANATAAAFSQAVVLPALAVLPGRARGRVY